MITNPVPALLYTPAGHNPTSHTTPELATALATEAFGELLNDGRTLSRSQIDFIKMITDHLTQNGVMDPALLYESPFTEIAPQGPDVLFPTADVDRIFSILHSVRATAAPVPEVA